MIDLNIELDWKKFSPSLDTLFSLASDKTRMLAQRWEGVRGAPVFTVQGHYMQRGWTEWTQGFQVGNAILIYEATGEPWFLEYGRRKTVELMAPHVSHTGVHDHGFNNVSTYGNLLRLIVEGKIDSDSWEIEFYKLALKLSGATQAARWTSLPDRLGYMYSFNGPQSLFADTIRSLRALAASHSLGHVLMSEQDEKVNLLERLLVHAETTARFNVYFGEGRDRWDLPGRVAHESIFNTESGTYRCPSSQQGYSPFTTWTRGLAWILLGFAEELEYLAQLPDEEFVALKLPYMSNKAAALKRFLHVAQTVADFYIDNTGPDGIPYWDTGAPNLHRLGNYRTESADPGNPYEPVDSSAAAISAQGLLRLGNFLSSYEKSPGEKSLEAGKRYLCAGARTASTLLSPSYLSHDRTHEGLLLNAVYHYPNRWDAAPDKDGIPRGESCMWGDYHMLELAVYVARLAEGREPQKFFTLL
jgi:hypothetical protein